MMLLRHDALVQRRPGEEARSQTHSYCDYTLLQRRPIITLIRHPLSKPLNHTLLPFMWTVCASVRVPKVVITWEESAEGDTRKPVV